MNETEGSTAAMAVWPTRLTSSSVNAPGPHPTSRTRSPSNTPAKSANGAARGIEYLPMKRSYAPVPTSKLTVPEFTTKSYPHVRMCRSRSVSHWHPPVPNSAPAPGVLGQRRILRGRPPDRALYPPALLANHPLMTSWCCPQASQADLAHAPTAACRSGSSARKICSTVIS
jgi:hypothetical protein